MNIDAYVKNVVQVFFGQRAMFLFSMGKRCLSMFLGPANIIG